MGLIRSRIVWLWRCHMGWNLLLTGVMSLELSLLLGLLLLSLLLSLLLGLMLGLPGIGIVDLLLPWGWRCCGIVLFL